MPARDIIVIGASAGGLDAVRTLMQNLPQKLSASLFVVIHTSPEGPGLLASILDRVGTLRVVSAQDGARIERGVVYVAPPDVHLIFRDQHIKLSRGPREHHFRPAIDPLFRSAAEHYGNRVIGVVLTGNMADGTHGLMVIKQAGGIAIVQDPEEATVPMMPISAIEHVDVDYILPTKEIGGLIAGLVMGAEPRGIRSSREWKRNEDLESPRPEELHADGIRSEMENGSPAPLTCPDCGGTLWEFDNGELLRYRCHVGHGFTAESLYNGQRDKIEDTLWSALRAIDEAVELRKRMAERARARNLHSILPRLERDIGEYEGRANALRQLLTESPQARTRKRRRQRRPPVANRARNNGKARR
jgi:two-component system chemotaxis response regulator CheB